MCDRKRDKEREREVDATPVKRTIDKREGRGLEGGGVSGIKGHQDNYGQYMQCMTAIRGCTSILFAHFTECM